VVVAVPASSLLIEQHRTRASGDRQQGARPNGDQWRASGAAVRRTRGRTSVEIGLKSTMPTHAIADQADSEASE
jgi:hypothetical protein